MAPRDEGSFGCPLGDRGRAIIGMSVRIRRSPPTLPVLAYEDSHTVSQLYAGSMPPPLRAMPLTFLFMNVTRRLNP